MGLGNEESPVTLPDFADGSVQVGASLPIYRLLFHMNVFLLLVRYVIDIRKLAESS
jgi:hypothetical protein